MKIQMPKDLSDISARRNTNADSPKPYSNENLIWLAEKTEQGLKRRSFITSLQRRLFRTSDTGSPVRASGNSMNNETTKFEPTTPPTNVEPNPALKDIKRASPNNTVPTPPMNVQQNSAMLDLPTEIRIRIYDYLMKPELPVCLMVSTDVYVWGQGLPKDIASCARVCKQMSREVQDHFWGRLHFKIRPDNGRGLPSSSLVGKVDKCQLLGNIRYAEICFPIAAIHSYDGPSAAVVRRMKVCCAMLERNTVLRMLSFNCDTTAFIGEHDDKGVELFARTFCDLLVKKRNSGVDVKLTNVSKRGHSANCLMVFREGGLVG